MRILSLSLSLSLIVVALGCQSKPTSTEEPASTAPPVRASALPAPRDDRPLPAPIREVPLPEPTPTAAAPSKDSFGKGPAVVAEDLTRVDPVEIIAQARKIAASEDENAILVSVYANHGVSAGTVDATGDDGVTFDFQWSYLDRAKPPGADKVEGGLWISARKGRFQIMRLSHATALMLQRERWPDPAPDPRCSARAAWKAALKSGVPENAVASMRYGAEFPGGPGKPYVWTFRVDGHPELTREIHGVSCQVMKR